MDFEPRLFLTVFATVFLAELADKTQIATVLFAADRDASRLAVFAGSAGALVLSSAIGVFAGTVLAGWLNPRWLAVTAGGLFMVIGAVTLWTGLRTVP